MSKKLETLEDLLAIDTDKGKAQDNKSLLKEVKQLLKSGKKKESVDEKVAEGLPYEAISVVGNKLVTVKFSLATKQGIVYDVEVDPRDTKGQNHMAGYFAAKKLPKIIAQYKKDTGEK